MTKQQKQQEATTTTSDYKGLPQLLHGVRWTQHLLAIIAEILILLSFAMSGMDANLGGIMTAIPWLKWLWAAMFALGIDAMFVIAWVRVRQCAGAHNWGSLFWNILLNASSEWLRNRRCLRRPDTKSGAWFRTTIPQNPYGSI